MIRFSPFRPGDARAVCLAAGLDPAFVARIAAHAGDAFTMLADGRPRAVGGVVEWWAGVCELWSFPAPDLAGPEAIAFARFCKRTADAVACVRLQATARADNHVAVRFLDFLGLHFEYVAEGFDPIDHAAHVVAARVRLPQTAAQTAAQTTGGA